MALTKIDDRGLKTPIDLQDNEKIRLGTGNDLELYHDGSNNYIKDSGTGNLLIDQSTANVLYLRSDDLRLSSYTGTETYIDCNLNGNVELYYDNSKKLETTTNGAEITGQLHVNGGYINVDDNYSYAMGTNNRAQLYHSGTHQYLLNTVGNIYVMPKSGEYSIACYPDGAVELYYDNAKRLFTRSNGITVQGNGSGSGIDFQTDTTHRGTVWANSSNQIGFLDTGGDWAIKHTNDDSTKFYVQTNQKATIDADGLKFGSDSAAANALDDYEEGTHTLVPNSNLTLNTNYNVAEYTKIGNVVTLTFLFFISSVSGSNTVTVTLPFTAKSGSGSSRCDAIAAVMHNGVNVGTAGIVGYIGNGSAEMLFYKLSENGSWVALNNGDLNANDEMYVTLSYRAA